MKYINGKKTNSRQLNVHNEAIAIYTRAINNAPKMPWGYLHRAISHNNLNQIDLALDDCNQAIELDNSYGLAYGYRGEIHDGSAETHLESAFKDYNQALKLNPKNISVLFHRGTLHARLGNFSQAIDDYNRAIKLKPHETLLYNCGSLWFQQNEIEKAGENFRQALAMNPNHVPSLINMGLILYELEQIQSAIQCFEKAVFLGGKTEAKLALAVSRFRQKKEDFQPLDKLEEKWFNSSYLRDQLWGNNLIKDTQDFLQFNQ